MKRLLLLIIGIILLLSACYHGHGLSSSPPEGILSGRITFVGEWPDSTLEVLIVLLADYPEGMTDTDSLYTFVVTNLKYYSDPLPMGVDEYDYEIAVPPYPYEWVLVVWFPDVENSIFHAKELGAYYADPQNSLPTPVDVNPESVTAGIDITADFANIERDMPFFKKGGRHEE